jgi:signal transduction histidine kinase
VSDEDKLFIDTERVRSVVQQAPLALLVTVVNAVLTALVLAPVVSHTALSAWVAMIFAVSGARWMVRQHILGPALDAEHRRSVVCRISGPPTSDDGSLTDQNTENKGNGLPKPKVAAMANIGSGILAPISSLGSLTTGILWGAGAAFLSPDAETHQLFFAFVVAGMCAGTSAVNSAHAPTVLAFILPASLPLAVRFLAEGSTPLFVSGLMTIVFAAALSLNSLRVHRAFGDRIRLQLALIRQGSALRQANESLRAEVAERLKAEAILHQAQKMEAIGHLTGGVAHDFNNLLQVVTGNLGMIERLAEGNPRILGYISNAEQAVQQGARLTGSLLTFARRQAVQVERRNVNDLLKEFHPILLRAIDVKINLETCLAPDLPDCRTDPAQFQSAILNVVINARDAMPGSGRLSITTAETILEAEDLLGNEDARPGRFVSVSIQDDGSGMAPDILDRVFEPFFTTKDVGKGSGLGLSQVYGFARQSGGHVNLRTTPGVGTCVTILLPAVDPATP